MRGPRFAIHLCGTIQAGVAASVAALVFAHQGLPLGEPAALKVIGGFALGGAGAMLGVWLFRPSAYLLFLAATTWNLVQTSAALSGSEAPWLIIAACLLQVVSLIGVGIFLGRTLYVAYGCPGERWWWEEDPRYRIKLPVQIKFGDETVYGRILDISRGGVLVDAAKKAWLSPGDVVELRFQFHNVQIITRARSVHQGLANRTIYGMAYHRPSWSTRRQLRQLVWVFAFLGFERRVAQVSWLNELVQSFRGARPELPKPGQLLDQEAADAGSDTHGDAA